MKMNARIRIIISIIIIIIIEYYVKWINYYGPDN